MEVFGSDWGNSYDLKARAKKWLSGQNLLEPEWTGGRYG